MCKDKDWELDKAKAILFDGLVHTDSCDRNRQAVQVFAEKSHPLSFRILSIPPRDYGLFPQARAHEIKGDFAAAFNWPVKNLKLQKRFFCERCILIPHCSIFS